MGLAIFIIVVFIVLVTVLSIRSGVKNAKKTYVRATEGVMATNYKAHEKTAGRFGEMAYSAVTFKTALSADSLCQHCISEVEARSGGRLSTSWLKPPEKMGDSLTWVFGKPGKGGFRAVLRFSEDGERIGGSFKFEEIYTFDIDPHFHPTNQMAAVYDGVLAVLRRDAQAEVTIENKQARTANKLPSAPPAAPANKRENSVSPLVIDKRCIECPHCGHLLSSSLTTCFFCGKSVNGQETSDTQTIDRDRWVNCPNCGHVISKNVKTCFNCGKSVEN